MDCPMRITVRGEGKTLEGGPRGLVYRQERLHHGSLLVLCSIGAAGTLIFVWVLCDVVLFARLSL